MVYASDFLETVSKCDLVTDIMKIDCRNENCLIISIQCKLANNADAHRSGSSISNQKIKNFWSHFRQIYLSWTIDLHEDLVATGSLILGKIVQMECLWFVFHL